MKTLKKLSVENVAAAIEADAGQALPGLREALAEAKAGQAGRVHTPEQIVARRRGRPAGSVCAVSKEPVKLRLDPDVLAALRATGDGWQTRLAGVNYLGRSATTILAGRGGVQLSLIRGFDFCLWIPFQSHGGWRWSSHGPRWGCPQARPVGR